MAVTFCGEFFGCVQATGPSGQMTWIRGGPSSLDSRNITEAIDGRYQCGFQGLRVEGFLKWCSQEKLCSYARSDWFLMLR